MDDILERAVKRMHELRERRQKLQTSLAEVEKELSQFESFFVVASKLGAEMPAPSLTKAEAVDLARATFVWPHPGRSADEWARISRYVANAAHGSKSRVIAEATAKVIEERGASTARKILEVLDEKGIGEALVPGRDEKGRVGYLSAVLSKDDRFESDRDAGGYVLKKKEEAPPAKSQEGPNLRDLLKPE